MKPWRRAVGSALAVLLAIEATAVGVLSLLVPALVVAEDNDLGESHSSPALALLGLLCAITIGLAGLGVLASTLTPSRIDNWLVLASLPAQGLVLAVASQATYLSDTNAREPGFGLGVTALYAAASLAIAAVTIGSVGFIICQSRRETRRPRNPRS